MTTQYDPATPAGAPAHTSSEDDSEFIATPRPWSSRRVPAALAAVVVLLGAGILLFDAVWDRTGHEAAAWRKRLATEFADRPMDDVWMMTGAATAAAIGLWLIVLALTPGLRREVPLRVPAGQEGMRAVLGRDGAALLVRDAAIRVPGVSRAKVRVGRRRVKVHADVGFRDLDQVRDELTTAVLHEQHEQLSLAHPPRLTVRVRRHAT